MGGEGERREDSSEVRDYYRQILPFYEQELADRGDGELWAWAASAPPGCRVLELGAGTGRATAALARTARRVVALELAPEMIARARRRLGGASNVWLVAADMRQAVLKPRFDLVLDAAWVSPDQRHAAGGPEGLVKENSGQGDLRVRETWHCDPTARLCTASYEYFVSGRKVQQASFPARLWSREELEHRARAAGLQITHLWGDYDRRPWDRGTSPRLIAEMRRG
jgi:SAM-dependent methyltransferase